jgi:hypothetical protein
LEDLRNFGGGGEVWTPKHPLGTPLTDGMACLGSRRTGVSFFSTFLFEGSVLCLNTAQRNIHERGMRKNLIQGGFPNQRSLGSLKFQATFTPTRQPCINRDIPLNFMYFKQQLWRLSSVDLSAFKWVNFKFQNGYWWISKCDLLTL